VSVTGLRLVRTLIAVAAVAATLRCSSTGPVVTQIQLSTTSVSFDALGATQQVTVDLVDEAGNPITATIGWTSNSPAVQVTGSGSQAVLTAVANGVAVITVKAGKVQAAIDVQVAQLATVLTKIAGDGQTGMVGAALAGPLKVLLTDRLGSPAPNAAVTFSVVGGGTVSPSKPVSGPDGMATTSWTLGTLTGVAQQVIGAIANGPEATFIASAVAGPPAEAVANSGQGQAAATGAPVPIAPSVLVRDAFRNPVPSVPVTFLIGSGGGTVVGPSSTTTSNGVATVGGWILGTSPGPNTLLGVVANLPSVVFTATGQVSVPTNMIAWAGQNQTAPAGTPVPIAPAVKVTDGSGNPSSGVLVTFAVTSGSGSVNGGSVTTDQTGVASVGSWTLGPTAGPNALTASAAGLPPVIFTATGTTGGIPASISISAGNAQAGFPGSPVSIAPAVLVRDGAGQPVAGAAVTFTITRGTGSLTGGSAISNGSGLAAVQSWTVGPGANCIEARLQNGAGGPITFVATGIPAPAPGYNVAVQYLTCVTAAQEAAFATAASRWGAMITGDVADLFIPNLGGGQCGTNAPAMVNRTIDDLLIFATLEPIDGPGAVLGSATWCFIRTAGNLPVIGRMRFDIADLDNIQQSGQLTNVIVHEMGHVLGVGTLWEEFGFLQNPSIVGGPALDTFHNGPNAIQGFNAIGGNTYTQGNKVPVENQFAAGTINSHWREGVLANELMTGFINNGTNPLSELTVRSLADFGYVVNPAAADPFFLALSLQMPGANQILFELRDDIIAGPRYRIDSQGRFSRIR
jgi:hypothetical protein